MSGDYSAILPEGNRFDFWEQPCVYTSVLHVNPASAAASDDNDGSEQMPLRTINRAAVLAQPGTKVLIHAGLYRECVRPQRGGSDALHMISYEAAGDGPVIIRASEEVTDFSVSQGWQLQRPGQQREEISHVRI